jgi:hypothetical protein
MGSLMYNTTLAFSGTTVAPFPGRCDTTVGDDRFNAGPVMNWLWKFANAFPDRSVTPLVASTVIVLEAGNPNAFRVATWLLAEVLIEIPNALPFAKSAIVLALIVFGFSDLENVSTTAAFVPTPVAPFCGVTIVTSGAVVSVPVPVVKVL